MWSQEDFEEDFDEDEDSKNLSDIDTEVIQREDDDHVNANIDRAELERQENETEVSSIKVNEVNDFHKRTHKNEFSSRSCLSPQKCIVIIFLAAILASIMLIVFLIVIKNSDTNKGAVAASGFGIKYVIPGTQCLDGSEMTMFVENKNTPSNTNRSKWVIHLQGGGFCSSIATCRERKETKLGSCKTDKVVGDNWDSFNYIILSNNALNPFNSYNKVVMRYCSGDMWMGRDINDGGIGEGMVFNGMNNFILGINFLKNRFGIGSAESVVLTGDSAGGVGVLFNVDRLASLLPGVDVVGNPVAGLFPINNEYDGPQRRIVKEKLTPSAFYQYRNLFNIELHEGCRNAFMRNSSANIATNMNDCTRPQVFVFAISSDLYIHEYLTDYLVTSLYGGVPTHSELSTSTELRWVSSSSVTTTGTIVPITNISEISQYYFTYSSHVSNLLQSIGSIDRSNSTHRRRKQHGAFAASCYLHTNFDLDWPVVNGIPALDGLYAWMHDVDTSSSIIPNTSHSQLSTNRHINIDSCSPYFPPCNPTCPRDTG